MGLFDKVKKILFDEEEIDDLPVRTDKEEKNEEVEEKKIQPQRVSRFSREDKHEKGGVVFHNEVEEDTITEVKVPVETPKTFAFPMMMDDEPMEELPKREEIREQAREQVKEVVKEEPQDTQELRLKEDEFNRTKEIERLREERYTRSKEEMIKEYNEIRRAQRENVVPRKEVVQEQPAKKEKAPYKVPPVISPVFGVLDKNYDPDTYEEARQKITLSNAGNTSALNERQYGPVSYNDQGIPVPKYQSKTIIITTTTNPSDVIKEELKKESKAQKEAAKIEEEIINNIINDNFSEIEEAFEETKEIETPSFKEEPIHEEVVEEPTIEYDIPEVEEADEDAVITGSPYDEMFEEEEEEIKPNKSINDLISEQEEVEETEEANITPDAPKNIEDNVDLDDTIETDLYNLIDSMYKDED